MYNSDNFNSWCSNYGKTPKEFPLEFPIGYVEDSSNELEYFLDKELELKNQLNGYNMYDNLHHHFEFLKPDRIPESFKYTVYDTLIEEDVQGYGKRTHLGLWKIIIHMKKIDYFIY